MLVESSFPFVDAGATDHRGLGRAVGEQLREQIHTQCQRSLEALLGFADQASLLRTAAAIAARGAQAFPQYVEELEEMARGAGVDLHLLLLAGCEESIMTATRERCTTLAFSAPGCVLLGHNEDWSPGYEDSLYLVRARLPCGTSFLSLAYIGSPPGSSVALNSHGIAFSGNALLGHSQPGIAKNLLLRSQIEARTLAHFETLATRQPRALSSNSMAVDRSGAAVNIELALEAHATTRRNDGVLVHTNHVLAPELAHLDTLERPCSKSRFARAVAMARGAPPSAALMSRILLSHAGWPHSICLHAQSDHYDDAQTIASAIVDLEAMTLAVANGPPCRHRFKSYRLES